MTVIKPEQKQAGRARRDLRAFQWYAAALMTISGTPGKPQQGGTVPGLPSDFEIDIATNSQDFGGVIEEPGRFPGEATTVITEGRAKIKCSGTGESGDSIKVNAQGMGVKASEDDQAVGRSYEAWADGQIVAFQIDKHVAKAKGAAFVPPVQDANQDAPTPGTVAVLTSVPPMFNNEAARYSFALPPGTTDASLNIQAVSSGAVTVTVSQNGNIRRAHTATPFDTPVALGVGVTDGEIIVTFTSLGDTPGFYFSVTATAM